MFCGDQALETNSSFQILSTPVSTVAVDRLISICIPSHSLEDQQTQRSGAFYFGFLIFQLRFRQVQNLNIELICICSGTHSLRADFLSGQKLLAAIFLQQKSIIQVLAVNILTSGLQFNKLLDWLTWSTYQTVLLKVKQGKFCCHFAMCLVKREFISKVKEVEDSFQLSYRLIVSMKTRGGADCLERSVQEWRHQ